MAERKEVLKLQISLKAARVNADYTQKEAAKLINVDVSTIVNWENGKTSPRATQLNELCRIYGVPVDYIFLRSKSS